MEVDRTYIGVYYYIMIVVVPTMFVFISLMELVSYVATLCYSRKGIVPTYVA